MFSFTIKRLIQAIPTFFVVSILVFLMMRLAPGDPARLMAGPDAAPEDIERIREKMGFDDPLPVQYLRWLNDVLHGDLGVSFRTHRPVSEEILYRYPNTIKLSLVSITFAVLIGVVSGVISATTKSKIVDFSSRIVALFGVSMPFFWTGLMLMLIFAVSLRWLPSGGSGTWKHYVLPGITLGTLSAGIISRMTRSCMLEVISQDYIRTARSKGLKEQVVVYKHALRNAMIPIFTVIGLEFGYLLAGSVITETIFAWPGLGRLLVNAIFAREYFIVQGVVLVISLTFVLVNLIVDICYGLLDPRVREGSNT
jgi:peptide/nickel transport system permease protein